MEKLVFASLEVQKQPVEIAGVAYELRELTGKQRDAYLTKNGAKMKYVKGKPAGLTTFDGVQTDLLSECLFDEKGQPVAASVMAKWPASIQDALFDAARKLSKLGTEDKADDEGDEKND